MRKPYWMPEDVEPEQVIGLYESGLSVASIKKTLGLKNKQETILKFLRENDVEVRGFSAHSHCVGCNKELMDKVRPWQKICQDCAPNVLWFQRFKKYGITKVQFEDMLSNQNGLCDLCLLPLPDDFSKVYVDHCHKQGHVRALIHNKCNIGLGFLENDKFVAQAFRYIERHKR